MNDDSPPEQSFALPAEWWLRLGHDLRGPIAPMRMAVQLLRSGNLQQADRDQALHSLDRQIDHMLANIDDIADLLRLNAGTFAMNPTAGDLNLVVDIPCGRSTIRRALDHRRVSLHCVLAESPVIALHDPTRFTELVEYLVCKSSEHTAPEQTLTLAITREGDRARVRIDGADASLLADPGLGYVTGMASVPVGELDAKPVLMREIARLSNISFSATGHGTGISFELPLLTNDDSAA